MFLKPKVIKAKKKDFSVFFFLLQNPIPLRAINIRYERA